MIPVGQRSVFYWHDHLAGVCVCVCVCVCLHWGWRMELAISEP